MKNAFYSALITFVIILPPFELHASESLRIIGGPSSIKHLEDKKGELEKFMGKKIEFGSAPSDSAIVALSRGMVFAVAAANPPEAVIKSASTKGLENAKVDDFEWILSFKTRIKIALNPQNPTQVLSDEQVRDLISGKTKSWTSINGKNDQVHVVIARDYAGISRAVAARYLNVDTIPGAEAVVNKDGLLKALKSNPGTIAFFSTIEASPEFTPKYLDSSAEIKNYLIFKRPLTEDAKKFIEFSRETKH
jgi:ABC-type phosphate transport system substrate-binding protein